MNKKENNSTKLEEEIKLLQKLLESEVSKINRDDSVVVFRGVTGVSTKEIEKIFLENQLLNWNVLDLKKDKLVSVTHILNKIDKLYELSHKDPLTGLGNRKKLEETLSLEIERSYRTKQPICLCFLDLDDFKKINDTMGHDVGDKVLKGIAEILKECCRKTDMIFRYGGEEIVILFPGTPLYHSEVISNRIRQEIKNHIFYDSEQRPFNVTCSMGIACYKGKKPIDINELIKEADKALYEAKARGKDKVVVGKIVDVDIEVEEDLKVNPEEKSLLFGKNI